MDRDFLSLLQDEQGNFLFSIVTYNLLVCYTIMETASFATDEEVIPETSRFLSLWNMSTFFKTPFLIQ